jgi:hypothetical protein
VVRVIVPLEGVFDDQVANSLSVHVTARSAGRPHITALLMDMITVSCALNIISVTAPSVDNINVSCVINAITRDLL